MVGSATSLEEFAVQVQTFIEPNRQSTRSRSTAFVVDNDRQLQVALSDLLCRLDLDVVTCDDASGLLEVIEQEERGIIIMNSNLPDASGLELQQRLADIDIEMPIVFISDDSDVMAGVEAMKAGAVDFLLKPLDRHAMQRAVRNALVKGELERVVLHKRRLAKKRASKLTRRERELFEAVTRGLMNKQIAFEMGISEIMVKIHRGNMMKKMEARSVADLVRMFELLGAGFLSSVSPKQAAYSRSTQA